MTHDASTARIAELANLVADVQRKAESHDVDATLAEITDSATRAVAGAQYAGVTVASRNGVVQCMAATHPLVVALDEVQQRDHEGPCLEAAWNDHVVMVDDLTDEQRWPRYRDAVLQSTPIRSIMSFRIFVDEGATGALNFFADRPRAFTEDSVELGYVFATHAALAWGMLRRDEQFRSALASRDVIGQAKGMLMERYAIDAVQAFELLKKLSQDTNTPLVRVAGQVVNADAPHSSY